MCYNLEELQELIDGASKKEKEILEHLKGCENCKKDYVSLQKSEEVIKNLLEDKMKLRNESYYEIIKKSKTKQGRFWNMNATAKKYVAVAASIAICVGTLSIPTVRTKAAELLKVFRVSNVQGVAIQESDFSKMEKAFKEGKGKIDFKDFGTVEVNSKDKQTHYESIKDLDNIKKQYPDIQLLKNVSNEQKVYINFQPTAEMKFSLDANKINDFLNYVGEKVRLPESLTGKTFAIKTGNILSYDFILQQNKDGIIDKTITIVQMDVPTIEVPESVDENQVIDTILSLDIMPDNIKNQLKGMKDLTSTIPIPYNPEDDTKKDITINGQKAILIQSKQNSNKYLSIYFKQNNKMYFVSASDCTEQEIKDFVEKSM